MAKRESSEKLHMWWANHEIASIAAVVYGIIPLMEAKMFARDLPPHLVHDLAAWKKGVAGPKASMKAKELV